MTERVLYVLANEPTGGVGVFVKDFTSHFSRDIIVDFLIYTKQRNTSFQKSIQTAENRLYFLPGLSIIHYPELVKKTDDFFRQNASHYRIVHLTYPGLVHLCLKPAKKYGIPWRIIHSFNSSLSDNPLKSTRNKLIIRDYKKYANSYLACSREAALFLYGERMANSNEVIYIHNAIDCDQYLFNIKDRDMVRERLGASDRKIVIAAGRLEKQKNMSFALDVFTKMHEMDPSVFLLIIGEGVQETELKDKAAALKSGSDAVMFLPFTQELNRYFSAADLLLFPSLYEGLPITVVDAQCSGLSCLLSDTISKEICLTDLVKMCSFDETLSSWAQTGLEMMGQPRHSRVEAITAGGYNIVHEAEKLENYYRYLLGKEAL